MSYYWVTTQAEYATALAFKSPQHLAEFFPRLLEHSTLCFSARDVLSFRGRKWHGKFEGEQCPPWRLTAAVCRHSMPLSRAGVVAREVAANARCAVGSWASPRLASVRVRPLPTTPAATHPPLLRSPHFSHHPHQQTGTDQVCPHGTELTENHCDSVPPWPRTHQACLCKSPPGPVALLLGRVTFPDPFAKSVPKTLFVGFRVSIVDDQ